MSLVIDSNQSGSWSYDIANAFMENFPDKNQIILYPQSSSSTLNGQTVYLSKSLVFPYCLVWDCTGGGYGTDFSILSDDHNTVYEDITNGQTSCTISTELYTPFIVTNGVFEWWETIAETIYYDLSLCIWGYRFSIYNTNTSWNSLSWSKYMSARTRNIYLQVCVFHSDWTYEIALSELIRSHSLWASSSITTNYNTGYSSYDLNWVLTSNWITLIEWDRVGYRLYIVVSCTVDGYTATFTSWTYRFYQNIRYRLCLWDEIWTEWNWASWTDSTTYYNNSSSASSSTTTYPKKTRPVALVQLSI